MDAVIIVSSLVSITNGVSVIRRTPNMSLAANSFICSSVCWVSVLHFLFGCARIQPLVNAKQSANMPRADLDLVARAKRLSCSVVR